MAVKAQNPNHKATKELLLCSFINNFHHWVNLSTVLKKKKPLTEASGSDLSSDQFCVVFSKYSLALLNLSFPSSKQEKTKHLIGICKD